MLQIVNADKEEQQDIRTAKTARYEERPPCPQVSTSSDTGGPVRTIKTARYEEHPPCPQVSTPVDTGGPVSSSCKGLMQCTATTTNKTPSECRVDKSNGHEEPQCPSSIQMTGDGAQDMLNILLGPLWSKTAAYDCEKKSEPAAYDYEKKSEPAAYDYEKKSEPPAYDYEKKSEPPAYEKKPEVMEPTTMNVSHVLPRPGRKKDWQTVHQVQGEFVVTKKKSSLKDMVAMFL